MRNRLGFTLFEVVVALSLVLVATTTFYQGRHNLLRRPQVELPTVQWYLMLRELENPAHHFVLQRISSSGRGAFLLKNGKKFSLIFESHGILILRSPKGGRITLMNQIKAFHMNMQRQLTVTTKSGQVYRARLLVPVQKGGTT